MIFIGTALNILSAVRHHASCGWRSHHGRAEYLFAPLPWKLLLYLAVWQSANRATPFDALTTRTGGAAWLIAVTII
jgi:hypothetical protein